MPCDPDLFEEQAQFLLRYGNGYTDLGVEKLTPMELSSKCKRVHDAIMAESQARAEAMEKALASAKSGRRR